MLTQSSFSNSGRRRENGFFEICWEI